MTEDCKGRPASRAGVLNMGTLLLIIGVAATLATILFPEFVGQQGDSRPATLAMSAGD